MDDRMIIVVGSINTDLVVRTGQLPRPGETVTGSSFGTFQGGKGANQAVAAARLGGRVLMIGKVGSDGYGAESLRLLGEAGVDCAHVATEPGMSGVAMIVVDEEGRNSIVVVPGANAAVTAEYVESKRGLIREAAMVLVQLEIPMAAVECLARICEEEGVPLMFDPAPAKELPEEVFGRCTWVTPNETEASFYGGAEHLQALGARGVVLKLGEQGVSVREAGAAYAVASFKVKTVDTTAAGDTFNGAFAVGLCRGMGVEESARFAVAAAAISVTRSGAQVSMPTMEEVEGLLKTG